MRVLLSTYGSRGDVEPPVGLAVWFRALGAEVRRHTAVRLRPQSSCRLRSGPLVHNLGCYQPRGCTAGSA
jgi:hypothetical protein